MGLTSVAWIVMAVYSVFDSLRDYGSPHPRVFLVHPSIHLSSAAISPGLFSAFQWLIRSVGKNGLQWKMTENVVINAAASSLQVVPGSSLLAKQYYRINRHQTSPVALESTLRVGLAAP
jgi:hypothetical protein